LSQAHSISCVVDELGQSELQEILRNRGATLEGCLAAVHGVST